VTASGLPRRTPGGRRSPAAPSRPARARASSSGSFQSTEITSTASGRRSRSGGSSRTRRGRPGPCRAAAGARGAFRGGAGEAVVVVARELPGPGVEIWHDVGSRIDLGREVLPARVGQRFISSSRTLGSRCISDLTCRNDFDEPPFDRIGRQGPRGAAEADRRGLVRACRASGPPRWISMTNAVSTFGSKSRSFATSSAVRTGSAAAAPPRRAAPRAHRRKGD